MEGTVNHIYKHLGKCVWEKEVAKVSSMLNISIEVQNNTING